jgi:hypothetical protein
VAKGADCKSAGYAFVGSSPTSPTSLKLAFDLFAFSPLAPTHFPLGAGIDVPFFVLSAAASDRFSRLAALL